MDHLLQEETVTMSVDGFDLEKARHLRDVVFPQAEVSLYIQHGFAYAVTHVETLIRVADLSTLFQMTDTEVLSRLNEALAAKRDQRKLSLSRLRIQAGLFSQAALAASINARFATASHKQVMSEKTVWNAENKKPISQKSALLILADLKAHGISAEIDEVDWTIGHQGKRIQDKKNQMGRKQQETQRGNQEHSREGGNGGTTTEQP
jgi:hypothetical protein